MPVVLLLQIEMLPQIQICQNLFCHLHMFCYQHIHMTGLTHIIIFYASRKEENNTLFFVMVFLFHLAFLCSKPKSQAQSSTMFRNVPDETLLVVSLTLFPEEKVVTYLRPCLVRQNLASLLFPAPCLRF